MGKKFERFSSEAFANNVIHELSEKMLKILVCSFETPYLYILKSFKNVKQRKIKSAETHAGQD